MPFIHAGKCWQLDARSRLVAPSGERYRLESARVVARLAHVRVRPADGGKARSLLFHPLNTPEPGFRRLRVRLRWAPLQFGLEDDSNRACGDVVDESKGAGNLPLAPVSHPLTHGASGEDHGGLVVANPHDR